MGPVDLAIAAAVLAGASWLLYRTLVARGGACAGCSQRGACATPRPGLVKLGARAGSAPTRLSGRQG
jgi:hypothetical protein